MLQVFSSVYFVFTSENYSIVIGVAIGSKKALTQEIGKSNSTSTFVKSKTRPITILLTRVYFSGDVR